MSRPVSARVAAAALAALFAGSVLAACSSAPAPDPEPEPSTSAPVVGGDPSSWAPLELTVDSNGETVEMVVGQSGVFTDLPAGQDILVESSDPTIVDATQPGTVDGVEVAPSITALAPGEVQVVVYDGDSAVLQFAVSVKPAG